MFITRGHQMASGGLLSYTIGIITL